MDFVQIAFHVLQSEVANSEIIYRHDNENHLRLYIIIRIQADGDLITISNPLNSQLASCTVRKSIEEIPHFPHLPTGNRAFYSLFATATDPSRSHR